MADFSPKNDAEILKKIKEGGGSNIDISNVTTDTEDMNKALNSVQANPDIEGTLANKIKHTYSKEEIDGIIQDLGFTYLRSIKQW